MAEPTTLTACPVRSRGELPSPVATTHRPPGPGLLRMSAIAMRFPNAPYAFLPEIARRYGDVVDLPVPVPGVTVTLVSHPDHVDHIMTRHHLRYHKHEGTMELVTGEPPALPLLEGEEWKRTRRPLNPFFSERALAANSTPMVAAISERVADWEVHARSGEWVDLEHEIGPVVMDGLLRSIADLALSPEQLHQYVDGARSYGQWVVGRAALYKFPAFVPRPFGKRGAAAKTIMFAELDRWVAERRAQPRREPPDILQTLLEMEFPGNPDEQYARMRSELSGLVFAGFETTAEALAWTIALLARNPRALGEAYAEVDALGGGRVEYEHLERLPYLRACFDEAQRFQAAPANVRTATEDDEIGGYFIPAGSQVVISPYGLQRDPRFWRDAERFEPRRFIDDKINRNAFIPFNIGPRKCMGSRMAYIEGLLTLATILQKFTVQIRDGWTPRHRIRVSTGLADGLPAKLALR